MHLKPASMLTGIAIVATIFASCTKEAVQNTQTTNSVQSSSRIINTSEMTFTQDSGFQKLILHPSPNAGQDVYVDRYDGMASGNQNYVPELPVNAWSYNGRITTRSFIKFSKLDQIPASAQIVSAKLYLYTAENFLNHPQGNTGDNRCLVQRVTGRDWKESGVTWSNQPVVTEENQAMIPASDESTQQFNYNPVVDVTTLVQEMVAHPETNFGFRLKLANEVPNAALNFASSEAASPNRRPRLIVYYQ